MQQKKITQPNNEFSVYIFGNSCNIHYIMNNRWVGSIAQQNNMTLVLQELLHRNIVKYKKEQMIKRKNCFFQVESVFNTHHFEYRIVELFEKKLTLQDEYGEYKCCYYMQDNDNCYYIFPDKLWRYKYYTDNSVEKIW